LPYFIYQQKEETMQKDMHFYGVYALARAAGINDKASKTISLNISSQTTAN